MSSWEEGDDRTPAPDYTQADIDCNPVSLTEIRANLGQGRLDALWMKGKQMSVEETVAQVLDWDELTG